LKKKILVNEWLKRARSNFERAKAGKISEHILYEDICFDCQQAVEKSLKALLVNYEVIFPRTHSISRLIELLEENGIIVPDKIKDAITLTEYAVITRYPGEYEPVDEEEYEEALEIAEITIRWVEKKLGDDR